MASFRTLVLLLCCCAAQLPGAGFYTGKVTGVFINPLLVGYGFSVTDAKTFTDNTLTAVYSGIGTSTLSWGSLPPGSGIDPDHSTVTFTGATFTNVEPDTDFDMGTITYSNGSSALETLIFGAVLKMGVDLTVGGEVPVTNSISFLDIVATTNGHDTAAKDADFLYIKTLGVSFNVIEGKTATATLRGQIVGDPVLTLMGIAIAPGSELNGFIGNGDADYVPEPATWIVVGIGLLLLIKKRISS